MTFTLLSFYYRKIKPGSFLVLIIFSTILVYLVGWQQDNPDFKFIIAIPSFGFLFICTDLVIDISTLIPNIFKIGRLSGLPKWKLNQLLKETINEHSTEMLHPYGLKTHIRDTRDIFQILINRYKGNIIIYKTSIKNTIDQITT